MKYQTLISRVMNEPWAIYPPKLTEICEFLALKAAGQDVDQEAIMAMVKAQQDRQEAAIREIPEVAVIPILGTIVHRGDEMSDTSGLASVTGIRKQFRAAMADEGVKSVIFDIDSPGGTVYGTAELAQEIRKARNRKPIYASVNGMAASAAYYLASQASHISMSPSSEAGSIGVVLVHREVSKALEEMGIKMTVIRSGKFKAEATQWEPLSDPAKENLQQVADEFHDLFASDVGKGRNVSPSRVKKDFGEGRMFRAAKALEVGMVDKIQGLDGVIGDALAGIKLTGKAQSIGSVRQFEDFLRDAGFSSSQAVTIASRGFASVQGQRDSDRPEPEPGQRDSDETETLLSVFRESLSTLEKDLKHYV